MLATTAVFITTVPPKPSVVHYTLRGPYICILGSFGLLIGGIIVASACVLVACKVRPFWLEKVCYCNLINPSCVSTNAERAGVIRESFPRLLHAHHAILPVLLHRTWHTPLESGYAHKPARSIMPPNSHRLSGILSAVWCADDPGVKGAAAILLIMPVSLAVLFGVSCGTAAARYRYRQLEQQDASHV